MVKQKRNRVLVVDGARTPFLRAKGRGAFHAADLAVFAARELILRNKISQQQIDEVITGCVMPGPCEANISRVISLRLGLDVHTPAWTVQRNCGSGLQAIDSAMQAIQTGRAEVVLAGGTEAMSQAPLLFNVQMVDWLTQLQSQRSLLGQLKTYLSLRPGFFKPVIALLLGLSDHQVNLSMGQTAEILAHDFEINRQMMDEYALRSHQKSVEAKAAGFLNEIVPLYDAKGRAYTADDGVRADSSLEKLGKLQPFFDKKYGQVTPGNSSQITDGAAYLLLATPEAVEKYQWPVLGELVDCQWGALDPSRMGLGPIYAIAKLLQAQKLETRDIDYWEINEAFAAQVLACLKAASSDEYCRRHLGLNKALGEIPLDRLNIDGGAIACGHPVGASGARVTLHALEVLKRNHQKQGIASMCIGGGQGGAVLIQNLNSI